MPIIQFEISALVMRAIQREAQRQQVTPREIVRDLLFDRFLQLVETNRLATDADTLADAERIARKAYQDSIRPVVTVTP